MEEHITMRNGVAGAPVPWQPRPLPPRLLHGTHGEYDKRGTLLLFYSVLGLLILCLVPYIGTSIPLPL